MSSESRIREMDNENPYKSDVLRESLKQLEFNNVLEQIAKFAYSDLGKDIVLKSIPKDDLEFLQKEHNLIEEMMDMHYKDSIPSLDGLNDISQKLYKSMIENAVLSAIDILNILDTIKVFRYVKNHFIDKEEQFAELYELSSNLYENRILEKHISEAIDENGEIRDSATRELQRIRSDIRIKSAKLRDRLQKILKRVSEEDLVRDDFYSIREGRFVLPMKVENKRVLPGIIHGISQTGATVFVEPSEIVDMNNDLSLLHNEEQREMYKILSNLTDEIGKEANQVLYSLSLIAHFDSVLAKAKYAIEYGGIKPIVSDNDLICLNNIRHPLLVHAKGSKGVKPLSIEFNSNIRGHLISGPNAGGKTVALKSVGLNILMAISGIFPLGECQTNFRYVFTSIGDQQSIENDLSTFSSQVYRLKKIIDNYNKDSLVLTDEIGSGTDPQEGGALASSLIDSFLNIKLYFIATTHQSSLKTYALNKPEIANDSLEFDSQKLKPTYKFLNGIPGNSYAFVLADNIGIPNNIINRAKKYLGGRHNELEDSIALLQKYKQEAESNALLLAEEKLKLEKLRIDYEKKLSEFKVKKAELINKAKVEAQQIVSDANSLVEKTIKEIKEAQKPIAEVKVEYNKQKEKLEKEVIKISKHKQNQEQPTKLKEGDIVSLINSNSTGTIISADDTQKTALVEFNGFKVKISYNELKLAKKEIIIQSNSDFIKFDVKNRIDVRGMRADEAIREIDLFMQDAIMNSVSMLTIVHGKGTGALREAIHRYLKGIEQVKYFKLGELTEGGAGVTIVELR
ncbi:MAG TPA: endonuclease MutS2 [Candidatus Kapabacteria bacterium]|nr:endonuclease MutS2 [Candidatus Kapabacteria bacterium]